MIDRGRSIRPKRIACGLLAAVLAMPAWAVVEAGVEFAPAVRSNAGELQLCSTALLRYLTIFKGYSAGLYMADCDARREVLRDVPKRLDLSYFWAIDGEQFADAAEELLAQSVPEVELERLRPRLDLLHRSYRSVQPGDRYTLTYLPGRGTELALNGESLATIEGADFARVYFGIWLGDRPIDASFRDALIGRGK